MPQRIRAVPRFALVALTALLIFGVVGSVALSAQPSEGTVTLENPRAQWQGKEFEATRNPAASRTVCELVAAQCDSFKLTADIDPEHWKSSKGGAEVGIQWENPDDDFDIYVTDKNGDEVASSEQGSTTSERVVIENANREDGPYTVIVSPFRVTEGATYAGGVLVQSRALIPAGEVPSEPLSGVRCENGKAGPFPCDDVDLESFVPISGLIDGEEEDPSGPVNLNDIWGWTDPETGREYALVGKTTGTAFVDITDAKAPKYLGSLPSAQQVPVAGQPIPTLFKTWRDIKVYEDHAYVVSEEPAHGMQVFDLTRLRGVTEPETFDSDADYTMATNPDAFGNAHNIAINEDSGFAYVIGTGTCEGGPHMVDIREPKEPKFAGCVSEDGYTHDSQCVNYTGPDPSANGKGREICFNSNEDTLTIVDVTDKESPKELGKTSYEGAAYSHQGWLTEDGRHFLLNDELDEQGSGEPTTTRIFDVSRLDQPTLTGKYAAGTDSIDHNLYTLGSLTYEANYRSGLRILDHSGVADGKLVEKGFFDVFPADDDAEFNGAWSNFPYYKSGVVVVSGIEEGLFVVRPRDEAAQPDQRAAQSQGQGQGAAAAAPAAPAAPPAAAPAAATATAASTPTACASTAGLRSVSAKRRGRSGLRLGFERRARNPVTVDVFRQSVGRRVTGEKLVARFTNRSRAFTWNGKANRRKARVGDGAYFVRYRMGKDVRRVTLRRKNGRFTTRPDFYRRATCDLLPSFKLSRPVFGGSGARTLGISYRVSADSKVSVTVTRGSRTVRRFAERSARANRTQRLSLRARGLSRGDYRVRITVKRGSQVLRSSLVSARL